MGRGRGRYSVCAALVAAVSALGMGCAGESARSGVLAPAMIAAWPEIEADARLGVLARQDEGFMAAQGGTRIGPGVAESRVERINQFGRAIEALKHD